MSEIIFCFCHIYLTHFCGTFSTDYFFTRATCQCCSVTTFGSWASPSLIRGRFQLSRNSNFRLRLRHLNFLALAPTSQSFWLWLQNDLVRWKLNAIVLFVQLACPTNYVCKTET